MRASNEYKRVLKCLSMASTTVAVCAVVTFVLSKDVPVYSTQPCNS